MCQPERRKKTQSGVELVTSERPNQHLDAATNMMGNILSRLAPVGEGFIHPNGVLRHLCPPLSRLGRPLLGRPFLRMAPKWVHNPMAQPKV